MARSRNRSTHFVSRVPDYAVVTVKRTDLRMFEDMRVFHPDGGLRAPRSITSFRPRLVVRAANRLQKQNTLRSPVPSAIGFQVPKDVAKCVRRKERREVIHAKRLQKRGARGSKHFNLWSNVRC